MSKVENINQVKKVIKPWGHELWLASNHNDSKYALKEIFIKSPHASSIQFHEIKEETNYVLSGEGELLLSSKPIDIEKFKNNQYSDEELKEIVDSLVSHKLSSGSVFHVKPGFVHRVISTNDLKMVETSTLHLDDVFRILDESGRGHGKIDSEHK